MKEWDTTKITSETRVWTIFLFSSAPPPKMLFLRSNRILETCLIKYSKTRLRRILSCCEETRKTTRENILLRCGSSGDHSRSRRHSHRHSGNHSRSWRHSHRHSGNHSRSWRHSHRHSSRHSRSWG